ncbi:7-deoxyloganetin glucosyltransferase [Sarracenia purpurea var. burkii]
MLKTIASVSKAQYLLVTSIYELEVLTFDALKATIPIPIYSVGLAIPYFKLGHDTPFSKRKINGINYLQWLDSQPKASVLYISHGSFLSISRAQMEEIIEGVNRSGIRFLWVAHGDQASQIKEECGEKGKVVPWCDQLRVLCHNSIGGFWSHYRWNSSKECVFAGLPFLACPISFDQLMNSKTIVKDWKIGWKVRQGMSAEEHMVTREEISEHVQRFINLESDEGKEIRARAKELRLICQRATSKGGSVEIGIDAFVQNILQYNDN